MHFPDTGLTIGVSGEPLPTIPPREVCFPQRNDIFVHLSLNATLTYERVLSENLYVTKANNVGVHQADSTYSVGTVKLDFPKELLSSAETNDGKDIHRKIFILL